MINYMKGEIFLLKVTYAAIEKIKNEVQDVIDEGKQPFIRLQMGIG
jgi:hypothetical protein